MMNEEWRIRITFFALSFLVEFLKQTRLTHILHSSFFILHFKDSSYQMKFLGVQSYEKRVVSHCFFDFYLEKRKKNLTFASEIVKRQAQMLESVDKSVSNTDAERRAGSTPALGT